MGINRTEENGWQLVRKGGRCLDRQASSVIYRKQCRTSHERTGDPERERRKGCLFGFFKNKLVLPIFEF